MPRVIFTEKALQDLKRLREFLKSKAPEAAKRAGLTIQSAIKLLERQPLMAPPALNMPEHYRDLTIEKENRIVRNVFNLHESGKIVLCSFFNRFTDRKSVV